VVICFQIEETFTREKQRYFLLFVPEDLVRGERSLVRDPTSINSHLRNVKSSRNITRLVTHDIEHVRDLRFCFPRNCGSPANEADDSGHATKRSSALLWPSSEPRCGSPIPSFACYCLKPLSHLSKDWPARLSTRSETAALKRRLAVERHDEIVEFSEK